MTSKHLQQDLFSGMSYAPDFHVRTSVWPGFKKESPKNPDRVYFTNSCESYAWYDQSSSSWKTWQRSLITDWTSFSGSFPKQGTMRNGRLYLQVHWEPVIEEVVGGSLPTPTTMDTKEESLKHATKLLQGKTHRSSGQPIQVTLSDAVMMEKIKENPELLEIYQNHQMEERPYLPTQEEFVTYLRQQTTIKELTAKTTIKKTTIEHWFRKDKKGFSYPSIENWLEIKPFLKTIKFDMEMTTVQTKEWTTKNQTLPTPTARDYKDGSWKSCMNCRFHHTLGRQIHIAVRSDLFNQFQTLPTPSAHEHKATGQKNSSQSGQMLSSIARRGELSPQTGLDMFLNPAFVEEMMGYEVGHTALEH